MAGTINLALTQQMDEYGQPLSGGALYIIQAGTVSTPQNAFQDTGLSIPLPNPIPLDAAGRIPQFFLADGLIKVRLQDRLGIVKFVQDNLLVIGPSAGGGGGGASIDPTTVIQTGDLKARYDTAIIPGFVRANGKTIGNATSGATELGDASAQALFQFLWGVDSTLPVTPSRGTSAAADWSASKQIALPDWRGCTIAALDDMGASPAGRLTSSWFGIAATVLGARSGLESNLLTSNQIPPVTFSGTTGNDTPDHTHAVPQAGGGLAKPNGTGTVPFDSNTTVPSGGASVRHQHPFSGAINGGGLAHANVQPTKLCTIYIKL